MSWRVETIEANCESHTRLESLVNRIQEMELEIKVEGASLYVDEYRLLYSRFHRIFKALNALLQTRHGLGAQNILLSLQKEVLEVYPDIPVFHLTTLSEALIESCLEISLNRELVRINMAMREQISTSERFFTTLLLHMKFLNPPDRHCEDAQKRRLGMIPVAASVASSAGRSSDSESDDMIKFLAVVRKLGIDIM